MILPFSGAAATRAMTSGLAQSQTGATGTMTRFKVIVVKKLLLIDGSTYASVAVSSSSLCFALGQSPVHCAAFANSAAMLRNLRAPSPSPAFSFS